MAVSKITGPQKKRIRDDGGDRDQLAGVLSAYAPGWCTLPCGKHRGSGRLPLRPNKAGS